MRFVPVSLFALALATPLAFVACSDSDPVETGSGCTAGEQQSCPCPGAPDGVQVCADDGASFGACDCGVTNLCGNGDVDDGEECDDGNGVNDDECSNNCTEPFCGDAIVQEGEDCDDGGATTGELNTCPDNCQDGSGSGGGGTGGGGDGGAGGGGNPNSCDLVTIFAGIVPEADVTTSYTGSSQWAYDGETGLQAGHDMCDAKFFGSHVCDYEELVLAVAKPDADEVPLGLVPATTDIWIHRTTDEMINGTGQPVASGGTMSTAAAGGRCNDWQYITNHISDGEYADFTATSVLTYTLDNDTFYDGVDTTHTVGGLQCGGQLRAIPCCFPCDP